MLVRYFVELPFDFARAEAALLKAPDETFAHIADSADRRGEELMARVGFGSRRRLEKSVEVRIGEAARLRWKTMLPIEWRASGPQGLFPVLQGDLEVARLDSDRTQLAISARYRPPLGRMGAMIDRAFLHRIAEATVKDFLDHLATQIGELAEGAPLG